MWQQRLIAASAAGNLSELERLVDARPVEPLGGSEYDGRTALHLAAAVGHVEIVSYLQSKGVDREPKGRWGNTPEHEARKAKSALEDSSDPGHGRYDTICELLRNKGGEGGEGGE